MKSGNSDAFVPAIIDPPEMTAPAARGLDWFRAAAIVAWIACGLWPIASMLTGEFAGLPAVVFVAAFATYGAALIAILSLPRRAHVPFPVPLTLAAVETVAALMINADMSWYLDGTGVGLGLLVIVAAQLPYFLAGVPVWAWILAQTVTMVWLVGGLTRGPALVEGFTFLLAALGFQVFAAASSILAISEGRARTNLTRANAELTATRELLAEGSRTAERLRISRDLHDTLGHHLTALSLQLDVASRLSDGKVAEHVRQAYAITRLLLSDVRNVVSSLRESGRINLAESIRALVIQPIDAQVHLDIPDTLVVEDVARAEALLRAVQEVMTNTSRHARARNLRIRLEPAAGGVTLHSRDDGQGTQTVAFGNGLKGMKERFETLGGRVDVRSAADGGFEVNAFLPLPQPA